MKLTDIKETDDIKAHMFDITAAQKKLKNETNGAKIYQIAKEFSNKWEAPVALTGTQIIELAKHLKLKGKVVDTIKKGRYKGQVEVQYDFGNTLNQGKHNVIAPKERHVLE